MTEPAVPPTPPVSLSALLAREDLGLRQIAGPVDDGTVIHWAHTSEMSDPYPYLLGGELLLTAGVHIPEAAGSDGGAPGRAKSRPGDYFDDYVSRIIAAGGAALGFGLAPVHDTVPRALVEACDGYGLPLIEVPPRTTFSGVARAVWQLMARARHAELRRVTEAHQSLAAAASHADPVRAVLRRLARRVGGRAVLYGPDGAELAAAGPAPTPTALADLAAVVRPGGLPGPGGVPGSGTALGPTPTPASATDTVGGTHLAAYALGAGQGFALAVATPRRDPGDHTIASVAAVLLSLLTGEQRSGTGAARTSALVRLLLGAAPEEVAPLLGDDIDVRPGGEADGARGEKGAREGSDGPTASGARWLVVHALPAGDGPPPDAVSAAALGASLGSSLADAHGDVVRVLVPAGREVTAQPGWTCGVSAPAAPDAWASADAQAARALARARATRTALVRHGGRTAFADLIPADDATAHARTLLAPLAASPALIETLRTWLSLHGGWDRTAVALSVHRNTVRQHVARCAALLNTDLDDPDVRMELWFALRAH
ncbi:helix-turn-helix domain-containing protein [Streptomyces ipomoeae]|uniref:helix-turn-helix domain-containing protein n=1 Tax=Streptomyces ipomoeae TaxID=103232 RepID=UPI0015F08A73|nr:PucR family transcriptional regulator [Streptomyces ipomoeae]MDX2937450.1 helix-turn-helix domain-containing protein [Streptomyces ipomoeae]